MSKKNRLWFAFSILLSCLGIVLILQYTRFAPGVGGDSVQYVMGAKNILEGNGYARFSGEGAIRPITGFPPLYSVVLAGVGLTGIDLFEGARILNAILFGGSIFLTSLLMWNYTSSLWASIIGSVFIVTSLSLVEIHGMVMTESLFIFLMLLAIYSLTKYLSSQQFKHLILIGILISLATMTRYIGLSLLAASSLSILLLSKAHWRKRLLDCVVLICLTFVPLYFWFRRNTSVGGTAVNREFIYHPMDLTLVRVFLAEVLSWFAPRILGLSRPVRNVLVLILALPWPILYYFQELRTILKEKGSSRKAYWYLPWVLAFYVCSYIAILIVNSTLLDAGTTLGAPSRYLAPVLVAVVMIFVIAIHRLLERWGGGFLPRFSALFISLFLLVVYILEIVNLVRNPQVMGGYFGYKVQRSDAVREFEKLDPQAPIISNNPELVYVMSGRTAYMWPIAFDHYKQEEREDYAEQLDATREKLRNGGVLIIFGWPEGAEEMVFDLLEAERLWSLIDVTFFGYPEVLEWQ
jgi:4-amino-4-deoxy-L-arabinose transferase-like glycosyltransferase